jgi:hypothetical protein
LFRAGFTTSPFPAKAPRRGDTVLILLALELSVVELKAGSRMMILIEASLPFEQVKGIISA